jgi:hypothetical protein
VNTKTPLLNIEQWGTFLGFAAALVGLSILSPKIAATVGVGVIIVLVFKNGQALGLEKKT